MDDTTLLPMTSLTLRDARDKLSALHFAKESLTQGERDLLYVAEALLRAIDTPSDLTQIRNLALKPGVVGIDLHSDGVEVCGTPSDSDAVAGFVAGTFSVGELRTAVGSDLAVTDCRT